MCLFHNNYLFGNKIVKINLGKFPFTVQLDWLNKPLNVLGLNQFFNSSFRAVRIYCVYIFLRRVVPLLNKRGVREGAERRTSEDSSRTHYFKTEKKGKKTKKKGKNRFKRI